MKLFHISLSIICCLALSACGENWLAGGASLGGSGGAKPGAGGTGTGVDENPDPHLPATKPPIVGKDVIKHIVYNEPVIDYCGALQRKMYFVDGNGQPLSQNYTEPFGGVVTVKVELTNKASFPVYEKLTACETPIGLFAVNPTTALHEIIKPARYVQCENGVSWRVYQPGKKEVYSFSAGDRYLSDDITEGLIEHYYIGYSPYYVQRELTGLPSETEDTLKCQPFGLTFNTVNKMIDVSDSEHAGDKNKTTEVID